MKKVSGSSELRRALNKKPTAKRDIGNGPMKAGHVNFSDDGDTAYIWARKAWMASFTVTRGDLDTCAFKAMIAVIASLAKEGEYIPRAIIDKSHTKKGA